MNKKIKIILIIAMIPISIYLWPSSLGGDAEILLVEGPSMLPTILPGSVIITKSQPEYQIDDIVSFNLVEKSASDVFGGPVIDRIVVHRIVDETEKGFVIKGDNNPRKDAGFPTHDDIRGKVILWIPYVGDMFQMLRNPVILVLTAVVTILIQAEQKRRKSRKEKLRRIRLGLPPKSSKIEATARNKKPKKPDYSLFYAALALNVITYVLLQIGIVFRAILVRDMGDIATGFLFRMVAPSFASTLSFALYFVFIFGLYFLTKLYAGMMKKKSKRTTKSKPGSSLEMLLGKDFNPVLAGAQFLWVMFILMSAFHLLGFSQGLIEAVIDEPCDPNTEIC